MKVKDLENGWKWKEGEKEWKIDWMGEEMDIDEVRDGVVYGFVYNGSDYVSVDMEEIGEWEMRE